MLSSGVHLSGLLLWTSSVARATSVWHISIFEGLAPPPGQGAPIQASALRDTAYLPAQIAGIVAAYVVSVLIIGSALLFVGRRLRCAAQESPTTLAIEMVSKINTNVPKNHNPSTASPATSKSLYESSPADRVNMNRSWLSPSKRRSRAASVSGGSQKKGHQRQQPSVQSSVVTFDESVIEDDRERNEKEMERLYAAVVDHDERKAASIDGSSPQQAQFPPELQHLRGPQQASSSLPDAESKFPTRTLTRSPRSSNKPTPISIHSRTSSRSSFGSFGKARGVKNLTISPPMGSPGLVPDKTYDENEPLSPRIYTDPGPPPPTPPQKKTFGERADQDDPAETRLSERPFRSPRSPPHAMPAYPSIPEDHQPEINQRAPDRERTGTVNSGSRWTSDHHRPQRSPAQMSLQASESDKVSHHHTGRPLYNAPLPLRNPYPTNHNADRASENIKATVLEHRAPGQSLRTPRTGVPMTPYSPYMPYTPLTPMTPSRLVTREERKRREKEEGRRVVTVEDAVMEEPDAWADAYN